MIDRTRLSSLRGQILTRMLIVGFVPLLLLAMVTVLGLRAVVARGDRQADDSRQALIEESVTGLVSEAETVGREIDLRIAERVDDVEAWAGQPAVVDGMVAAGAVAEQQGLRSLSADAVERRLAALGGLDAAPTADAYLESELERLPQFLDVLYTDANGYTVGWVGSIEDYDQSDESWWIETWVSGVQVGQVVSHPGTGAAVVPIAVRVDDGGGRPVGVVLASLDVGFVTSLTDLHATDGIELTVITQGRRLLAETATDHDPGRLGADMTPFDELSSSVAEALVTGSGSLVDDTAFHGFATVEHRFEPLDGQDGDDGTWHVIASEPTDTALAPLSGLDGLERDLDRATGELVLAVVLVALFAAMASVFTAMALSRRILAPVRSLTLRVDRAAHETLPDAVASALTGASGDATGTPGHGLILDTDPELGRLAEAFNSVQETAIRLAREQADLRAETAEMFANLGRRSQSLVQRQIRVIDDLEAAEEDPARLAELFKLDNLATRMRRNAESLLVIAGQRSTQRRIAPARIELVAQRAMGEVEGYERIELGRIEPAALSGQVVSDVAHLLAELFDNALAFSPPDAPVVISGMQTRGRYLLSVIDRGIGMTTDELARRNAALRAGDQRDVGSSKQLGLLVVARLAGRHGIGVRLQDAEEGGTVAVVELPEGLLTPVDEPETVTSRAARTERSVPREPATVAAPAPSGSETDGGPGGDVEVPDTGAVVATDPGPAGAGPDRGNPAPARADGRPVDRSLRSAAPTPPPGERVLPAPPPQHRSPRDLTGPDLTGPDGAGPDGAGSDGDGADRRQRRRRDDGIEDGDSSDAAAGTTAPPRSGTAGSDRGARRPAADPSRRATDRPPVDRPLGDGIDDPPARVVRRQSRRPVAGLRFDGAETRAKRRLVGSPDDVVEREADQVRRRWSSFHDGRRRAADGEPRHEVPTAAAGAVDEGRDREETDVDQ